MGHRKIQVGLEKLENFQKELTEMAEQLYHIHVQASESLDQVHEQWVDQKYVEFAHLFMDTDHKIRDAADEMHEHADRIQKLVEFVRSIVYEYE